VHFLHLPFRRLALLAAALRFYPEPSLRRRRHLGSGRRIGTAESRARFATRGGGRARTLLLPPGFEIELVRKEEPGVGKFVPLAFDQKGRLWTTTAFEYPVDGNENAAQARALYENPGKDKVLVFDTPLRPARKSRVSLRRASPFRSACSRTRTAATCQHGPDIVLLHDIDNDGRADKREVILTGFGVQDSHLFPHQFMRAPAGWIWMAQGALITERCAAPKIRRRRRCSSTRRAWRNSARMGRSLPSRAMDRATSGASC
jgi:hypothetical protein